MASIEKRNGFYRIRVSVGTDENGKRLYEYMNYTPTATAPRLLKRELEKVASEFEDKVQKGLYLDGDKITFSEYVKIWREQWASSELTQSGKESYESILRNRAIPMFGRMEIGKIRPIHIQDIVTTMKNEGKAPKTIKRTITAINSVFRYAFQMEVIESNPCERVRLPKQPTRDELHYFTIEQTQTFFEALTREYTHTYKAHKSTKKESGKVSDVKEYTKTSTIPYQWRVYFNLAIMGAFRRGELLAITWNDIDWDEQTISIKRAFAKTKELGQIVKTTKTESGIRTISLPSDSIELLKEWRAMEKSLSLQLGTLWKGYRGKEFDKNYIFIQLDSGLPMNVDTPTHKFREILEMYNSSCEKEEDRLPLIKLHDLRHTSATLLLSNGADIETVSHRLGHKHCSVTLDVYGHWTKDTDRSASDTLKRLFEKKA